MKYIEAFDPSCITTTNAQTKDDVLRDIAELINANSPLPGYSVEALYRALRGRELAGSTGFENGIAMPHCALENLDRFVAGVLTASEGIPFESADGRPSQLFVFVVGPKSERNAHMGLISAISRILLEPGVTERILSSPDANTTMGILAQALGDAETDGEEEEPKPQNLFTVFVQREDVFDELLGVFAAAVHGSIMVFDAQNAGPYLNGMPLFSSYWSDSQPRFNRIILGVVDRNLSNNTIRRIHAITEKDRSGVLVTMQELAYTSGAIEY